MIRRHEIAQFIMRLPELNSYHRAIKPLVLQHKTAMLFQCCTDNAAGQGILNGNLSLAQFVLVICVLICTEDGISTHYLIQPRYQILRPQMRITLQHLHGFVTGDSGDFLIAEAGLDQT